MTEKRKPGGRIPAAQLSGVKPWRLPRVQSGHVVRSPFQEKDPGKRTQGRSVEEVIEPQPLTVEELEKIRREARDDAFRQGLEEGRQQGRAEGLESGRREGHEAAYREAQGEIDVLKARLGGLLAEVEAPLGRQQGELEQALLRLVVDTAEAVVKRTLAGDAELLQRAVHEAVAALPQMDQPLCLILHPDDVPLVTEIRDRERHPWEIHGDASVTPGGLRIKGACSFLDYSVEHRFSAVVEQLLQAGDEGAE